MTSALRSSAPTLGDLGYKAMVLPGGMSSGGIEALFRTDRRLRAVVIDVDGTFGLLTRDQVDHRMAGRLGYGRALNSRAAATELLPAVTFTLPPSLDLAAAATALLGREEENRYQDLLVVTPGGPRIVPVSEIFQGLSDVFRRAALHDPLTGLANRLLLKQSGRALLEGKNSSRTAAIYVDLDDFKVINDTFGHRAGDGVLVSFGTRLRACTRPADTVARLGGDEFAVLLSDVDESTARAVAQRILQSLDAPFKHDGHELRLSATLGLAMAGDVDGEVAGDPDGDDPIGRLEYLLRHADAAMLQAKYEGKRDEFIHVAEHTGEIHPIGRWVINQACAQARLWVDAGTPRAISVNISPLQLAAGSLVADLHTALQRHGVPASLVNIEITESAAIADIRSAAAQLQTLIDAGIGVTLDDYGTAYSSLAMLRELPLTGLKLDKSFIDAIDNDPASAILVAGVIAPAKALGLNTTAEGVERETQLSVLRELGCDTAQGYLISRPLPADELVHPEPAGEMAAS